METKAQELVQQSRQMLRSAKHIFGEQHVCQRSNLTHRVNVMLDQRRSGRTISMSATEWKILHLRAQAAGLSASSFVRQALGLNPPTAQECPCGGEAERRGTASEIWDEVRREHVEYDEGDPEFSREDPMYR